MPQQTQYPYFDPYGYMRQPPPQPVTEKLPEPPKPGVVYRPVGGVEEVRAFSIDWDETVYFLEDVGSGMLYKKRFAGDRVVTTAYAAAEMTEPVKTEYASAEAVNQLRAHIEELEKRLLPTMTKAGKKDE